MLLLGAPLGLALAWPALALVGHGAMQRLLRRCFPGARRNPRPGSRREVVLRVLSLGLVLGNFFCWHLHHGHLPFAWDYLVLVGVERVLRAARQRPGPGALLGTTLGAASFALGAMAQSVVFLVVPLVLAAGLWLALARANRRRGWWPLEVDTRGLSLELAALALGLVVASPRLWAMVSYQQAMPRVVADLEGTDSVSLPWALAAQVLPTFGYRYLGVLRGPGPWGIWETSAFTVGAWVALAAALGAWWARSRGEGPAGHASRMVPVLLGCVALVGFGFSLGDLGRFSPFGALNVPLGHSMRVAGRFALPVSLAVTGLAAWLLGWHRGVLRRLAAPIAVLAPLVVTLNFFSFTPTTRWGAWRDWQRLEPLPAGSVQHLTLVRPRDGRGLPMYEQVLANRAVLNCYDPIARETRISREKVGRPELMDGQGRLRAGLLVPLVELPGGELPEPCLLNSYLTQTSVHLDASCPAGTCVNINGLNPGERTPLRLDPVTFKYCLPRAD